jgi:HD-GYP domain-containing protein (c-di-GMP phosphodiesterase class II)
MITKNNNAHVDAFSELASATDEFELYRNEHAARIANIADEIAQRFLLASRDRKSLRSAALLHDLGEAAMERDYIQRAGELTEEERSDLLRHPVIGEQEAARAGADRATTLLVRWHHEWWNGGGYPDGLRGEEIPLACRILRLADSYASLTAARPFRGAYSAEVAREMIVQRAGIEFDPRVVKAFVELDLTENVEPAVEAVAESPGFENTELFSSFMK